MPNNSETRSDGARVTPTQVPRPQQPNQQSLHNGSGARSSSTQIPRPR